MSKKKEGFFKHLESIQLTKKYNFDSSYNSVVTSAGLSQHVDSVMFVNDLNMYWQVVTPKMHYDYLFHTVRQMRRPYVKWAKKTTNEDVKLVMDEYSVSRQKAIEYLKILTKEQLKKIQESRDLGGN